MKGLVKPCLFFQVGYPHPDNFVYQKQHDIGKDKGIDCSSHCCSQLLAEEREVAVDNTVGSGGIYFKGGKYPQKNLDPRNPPIPWTPQTSRASSSFSLFFRDTAA